MTNGQKLKIARTLFVIYVICVLFLCLKHLKQLPDVPASFWGIPSDKWAHFLMFLPFPVLSRFSLDSEEIKHSRKILRAFAILVAGCAFAALTEYLQGLTPYRQTEILDFAADVIGMSLATIAVLIFDLIHRNEQ